MAGFSTFFRIFDDSGNVLANNNGGFNTNGDGDDQGVFLPSKVITITAQFSTIDPSVPAPAGSDETLGLLYNDVLAKAAIQNPPNNRGTLYFMAQLISTTDVAGLYIGRWNRDGGTTNTATYHVLYSPGDCILMPVHLENGSTYYDELPWIVAGNSQAAKTSRLAVTAYYQAD